MAQDKGMVSEVELSVPGMLCQGCAEKVRTALLAIPGVRKARPSAWRKRVRVSFDPARVAQPELLAALSAAGFENAEARP
jgi:copper chaperone CopZ